jgi:thiamine biosynthesis lipoprotein
LYRFGEDERVPSEEELKEAHVSFANLTFDEEKASLSTNTKVDLGGMGKGFSVDKAAAFLREKKVDDAVISASGDIRCLAICKIEIQNPFGELPLASFETLAPDTAISTSGNYNRYVKSTQNNHLINPKTKVSQDKFISLTLISHLPNSDIDAYATAASVMSSEKAYAFLDTLPLAYIILQADKKLVVSQNINKYVKTQEETSLRQERVLE